ncbi:MAG: rhodanese-like domain-containing protein [Kofleriaceae bacterium]|nr:rhodanese-like domain-containing protein [Kofleriaceae bacterium]MBP6838089.1 rhodanese-like domain-containing protein [Kofleriaceae bacterium]MBP9204685.1 rhodanese-like domain-containing protein [Kofleriaceae bacterium]
MRSCRHLALALALPCLAGAITACDRDRGPGPAVAPSATPTGAGSAAPAPATRRDPATARQWLAAGAVALDVRSAEEFAAGHLPGAINIPVGELAARKAELLGAVGDLARDVVVYCASGNRAGKAVPVLAELGLRKVVNGGGYDDLR